MVLIASPNNPTGNSLTSEELDQILSFISPETVVVIDEAYASFANKDTSYIKPLLEKFPNLLIVRTLSKFYGLPGLRLGFAFMGTALTRFLNYSTKYLGYNRFEIDRLLSASCRSNGRRPANVHERTEYP